VEIPSTSSTSQITEVFETPKRRGSSSSSVVIEDNDNYETTGDVGEFGRGNFGERGSPYLTLYLYNRRFLDKQYTN
jgi:hypothetical protein